MDNDIQAQLDELLDGVELLSEWMARLTDHQIKTKRQRGVALFEDADDAALLFDVVSTTAVLALRAAIEIPQLRGEIAELKRELHEETSNPVEAGNA